MLISAACPRCQTVYHVQDSLRGKAMRCQVTTCRHLFVIDETPRPDVAIDPPAERRPVSGGVGDLVPLLPVEDVAPPEPAVPDGHVSSLLEVLPAEAVSPAAPQPTVRGWEQAPPPRRGPTDPAESKPASPAPPVEEKSNGPRVVEAGTWSAPPVRRGSEPASEPGPRPKSKRPARETPEPLVPVAPDDEPHAESDPVHRPPARWARWVVGPLVLLACGVLGGGAYLVWQATRDVEQKIAGEADTFFADKQFRSAAERYGQLTERYPDSEQIDRYRFRQTLSELRHRMAEPSEDLGGVLDHFEQFVKERHKDGQLPDQAADLGSALIRLLTERGDQLAASPPDEQPLALIERAAPAIRAARSLKLAKGASTPAWNQIDEAFARLRGAVARRDERRGLLDRLTRIGKTPSYASIVAFEQLLRQTGKTFPELAASAEVKRLEAGLYDGHLAAVRYVESAAPGRAVRAVGEDPAVLIDPLIQGEPSVGERGNDTVLALMRGLLYGLRRADGKARWAVRLGVDTTALPVRVPGRAGSQERILALSSDTATLTALDAGGNELWRYRVGTPVLGRPVVVDQRAYLAAYSGEIHEIELIEGRLLGRYLLGQRLTAGGTREPGTRRVYFPADDGCVYVLDVGVRRCEAILYTRHPAGALRGEVAVLPPAAADAPGYLILTQADGLDRVRLRVWELPIKDGRAAERSLQPPVEVQGWTSFTPYHDPEKLVLLSDAGRLGLFGIRQPHNRDQALFPLLGQGSLALDPLLLPEQPNARLPRGRGEVVEVQGHHLWVLAGGRLRRLCLGWSQSEGLRLVPVWDQAQAVGAPIHASQVVEGSNGRSQLILATRPANRSCNWVSCVDDETGRLLWRRQLGLVARGEPVPLPVGDGPPQWLVQDQSGALYRFDPAKLTAGAARWVAPGQGSYLAGSLDDNPGAPPVLLPGGDGRSALALASPGGKELVVRQVTTKADQTPTVSEARLPLTQPLAGQPARVGAQLLLPLADGSLARVPFPLPKEAALESGPGWRAERATADDACHLVAVSETRFVSSDGARGLSSWEWKPGSTTWDSLPPGRDEGPALELRERVLALTRLPDAAGGTARLAVADSSGGVTLVEVQANGALQARDRWDVGGPISHGPFLRTTAAGLRLGCVVDRSRLVWIDPARPGIAWSYETPGSDPVVGEPQLAGAFVAVADQSGLYVALDAATGRPAGPGHQLRGSIAPACSPVLLDRQRLLAPLSDGTLLLLPLERLKTTASSAALAPLTPGR